MLYKRKNSKFWWIKFTDANGNTIRHSSKTTCKKKAQELADKLKAQSWDQAKLGHKPEFFWNDAVVKWLSESQKRSLEDDRIIFLYLDRFFSGMKLVDITRDQVEKVISDKLKHASPGRANRVTTLIRAVLRKAEREWGWIEKAPKIRRLKEESKRIRWITKDEAGRLCEELPSHVETMVRFSLLTGLRESNVTGLEWSQIDMQRKVAWVHADQAKGKKAIGIPLNEEAVRIVKMQIGKHNTHVFTYRGKPVKKAGSTAWKNALKRAGIEKFRWHDLRHTWASWHVQSGTPLMVLKELGGWNDYETVLRYAHLAPEHLAEHADNISGVDGHIFGHIKYSGIKKAVAAQS